MLPIRRLLFLSLWCATAISCYSPFIKQPELTVRLQDSEEAQCTLRVTVIGEEGERMPGAIVRILVGPTEQAVKAVTQGAGEVEFSGLVSGPRYVLIVDCPGYHPVIEERLFLIEKKNMQVTVRVISDPSKEEK